MDLMVRLNVELHPDDSGGLLGRVREFAEQQLLTELDGLLECYCQIIFGISAG